MWEYGKGEGDGLNQNRPRTAALRRAAGDRAGYLVTGRGGGAYAELSFRTTTGASERALAQIVLGTRLLCWRHRVKTDHRKTLSISKTAVVRNSLLCQPDESFPSACLHLMI